MKFIKDNFQFLVIVGLILFVFGQRIFGPSPANQVKEVIYRDTSYHEYSGAVPSYQPIIVESRQPVMTPSEKIYYKPDTNYLALLQQYRNIVDKYFVQNISKDSIKIDSIGYVYVDDTVSQNRIVSRGVSYNYKIPTITNTIIKTNPPRRQLYVGAGLYSDQNFGISRIDVGILYKNKKEQIFILKPSYDLKSGPGFGLESYWKIRLKK